MSEGLTWSSYEIIDNKLYFVKRVNREIIKEEAPFRPHCFVPKDREKVFEYLMKQKLPEIEFDVSNVPYTTLQGAKVVKVEVDFPYQIKVIRDSLFNKVKTLEADIPYRRRVMIDQGFSVTSDYKIGYWDTEFNERTGELVAISLCSMDRKVRTRTFYKPLLVTEEDILEAFFMYANSFDMIIGFNSDGYDVPQVKKVAERYNVVWPREIVWLDMLWALKTTLKQMLSSWNLAYVAENLLKEKRIHTDKMIFESKPDEIAERCEKDAELLLTLDEKYGLSQLSIAKAVWTRLLPDEVSSASRCIDAIVLAKARSMGYVLPNVPREKEYKKHSGAMVLQPTESFKIYKNVGVLDFTSLYPNIIIKHKISPDPERRMYPEILKELLVERLKWKEEYKKTDSVLADSMQWALKIFINAFYGMLNYHGFRISRVDLGDMVATKGREILGSAIEVLNENNLNVIYGDTDSVFFEGTVELTDDEKHILVEQLGEEINEKVGLDFGIEFDKQFKTLYFPSSAIAGKAAKKKYAGLSYDNEITLVGMEAVRSDVPKAVRELQKMIVKRYLEGESMDEIKNTVKAIRRALYRKEFTIEDLALSKSIKSKDTYKVKTPQLKAFNIAQEKGLNIRVGDKIRYVFTVRGAQPLGAISDQIDRQYYWRRVFAPVFERSLGVVLEDDRRLDEWIE